MLTIGEIVNERHRIDAILGKGGMGIVYKAWDLVLKRPDALKEITASIAHYESFVKRFAKEAEAIAKLNHPNIVIVYDFLQYKNNSYIIMEYVPGETLTKKLEQAGALSYENALPIFKQILAAVSHAHQVGIIHRDLKPDNVMITPEGIVKVTDFGLAKIQNEAGLTDSTNIGGTLYYLSPEQVEEKPVDYRSDIYSLGMTCYEVLAGYMPLKDKKTTVEILNAILRDNFLSPTKFNAKVPEELSKIVEKAISLNPGKRFQSAREMLAEVEIFEERQRKKEEDPAAVKRQRIRFVLQIIWGIISVVLVVALLTIFVVPDLPLRILKWVGILSPTKVAIYTEPAGAEIRLGGESAGKSPLRNRFVDFDTLRLSIQKPTYFAIDTSIPLTGVQDTALSFTLIPAAVFAVEVAPESAEVRIDDKIIQLDQSRQLELSVGEHDLLITGAGYDTIYEKITLQQGTNTTKSYILKSKISVAVVDKTPSKVIKTKPPVKNLGDTSQTSLQPVVSPPPLTGILKLMINPPSDVYIGDSLAAKAATQCEIKLSLSAHNVKVIHSTLGTWYDKISITPNDNFREIDFTKKYTIGVSAFDLTDNPLSAEIYLDGRPTGKLTPDHLLLNFGRHKIEAKSAGYESERRELNVEKDEKLRLTLKRRQ